MSNKELLTYQARLADGKPQGLLVLIHGRGTDELDLMPLAEMLDPEKKVTTVTPRGPLTLPPGGAHWYQTRQVGHPDRETFDQGFSQLENWLSGLVDEIGIGWDRMVIAGFSQGAVMAYALGLGKGRPKPAGVIALSGFIPKVKGFELDLESRERLEVAIYHGSYDPTVDVMFAREARQLLQEHGLNVFYNECQTGHTIDPQVLPLLISWLTGVLG